MKFLSFIVMVYLPVIVFAQQDVLNKDSNNMNIGVSAVKMRGLNPPKIQSFIVPGVLIGYGLVSLGDNGIRRLDFNIQRELQRKHPDFSVRIDDYLQFAPVGAFYALNLAGVKSKHSLVDGTALFVLSRAFVFITVSSGKSGIGRERPDFADRKSFPSGHAANTFAAAEFLNQEYRDVSPWIGYAGYTVATITGVLRMYNNKHWLSDVVAGAGVGIASAKLAYLIYPNLKKLIMGKQVMKYSLVPMYQQKAAGLSFNGTF
ncbi:membrane-associated phospholipid phosphatase [Pedobacter cryoconitis]|uniref:phosphatase PAP2 family protein n=1 Tax=Pedobacter cryoconitis TaxID=188932 RepID=UPI0018067EB6|nr:phosphatase PAP2 family protein [Pedobacter cryoconitis]MBB6274197.1 membrane-associated phospholipid phosphatase [Pedobacter cryoconitis]